MICLSVAPLQLGAATRPWMSGTAVAAILADGTLDARRSSWCPMDMAALGVS